MRWRGFPTGWRDRQAPASGDRETMNGMPQDPHTSPARTLVAAARERIDRLQEEAASATGGIEHDHSEFRERAEGAAAEQGGDLAGALSRRMADISRQCAEVSRLLDTYSSLLIELEAREPGPSAQPMSGPVRSSAGAGPDTGAPEPSAPPPIGPRRSGADGISEGVRLLAAQMSAAGADRDEIARRLGQEFGVSDADAVVAALFGR